MQPSESGLLRVQRMKSTEFRGTKSQRVQRSAECRRDTSVTSRWLVSVLHQQVCRYVSCLKLHVQRDGNPDGILNAAFNVVSFSGLVHPSLVYHLLPSQPLCFHCLNRMGKFTLHCTLLYHHNAPDLTGDSLLAMDYIHHILHNLVKWVKCLSIETVSQICLTIFYMDKILTF